MHNPSWPRKRHKRIWIHETRSTSLHNSTNWLIVLCRTSRRWGSHFVEEQERAPETHRLVNRTALIGALKARLLISHRVLRYHGSRGYSTAAIRRICTGRERAGGVWRRRGQACWRGVQREWRLGDEAKMSLNYGNASVEQCAAEIDHEKPSNDVNRLAITTITSQTAGHGTRCNAQVRSKMLIESEMASATMFQPVHKASRTWAGHL